MTNDAEPGTWRTRSWDLLATLAVLTLPSLLWLRVPFWHLQVELLAQPIIQTLGFVAGLWAADLVGGRAPRRLLAGEAAFAAVLGVGYVLEWSRPDVDFSRVTMAIGFVLGVGLIGLREIKKGRARTLAFGGLLGAVVYGLGFAAIDAWRLATSPDPVAPPPITEWSLSSSYYPLQVTLHDDIVAPEDVGAGGGIAIAGDRVMAVTGTGAFYLVTAEPHTSVVGRRLPLSSPANKMAFEAGRPRDADPSLFRVHDLAMRSVVTGWEIFASHHLWNVEQACFSVGVSRAVLDDRLETVTSGWTLLFETRPCLSATDFGGEESGGRLAWRSDRDLILTVGDHEFDGWNRELAAAQDDDTDYGKTFVIDAHSGHARRFTSGHRNPQGLYVTPQQQIWSTEHGPRGGDELNLLVAGGNYGWPYATHGTAYERQSWPIELSPVPPGFTGPVFAWVPSVGVTNVIRIEQVRFPRWQGNLLVSSLRALSLYRLALDGTHVVYAEPLSIGRRIRDLIEAADGSLWLWGDEGEIIMIVPNDMLSRGEELFVGCDSCHSLQAGEAGRTMGRGPDLDDMVGRPIASVPGFSYSPALRALEGNWTEDRLDAFLADPGEFAPGTSMSYRVPDPQDRAALIEFLSNLP